MSVNGLVLCAGMSTRMHAFKPLLKIGERTMIEMTVLGMLEAGIHQVVVVTGFHGEEVQNVLSSHIFNSKQIKIVQNPDYETTQMLDSIKMGLADMESCEGFFITPGDMPAIAVETYQALLAKATDTRADIVFPVINGKRKHPPYLKYHCRASILQFQGESLRAFFDSCSCKIEELVLSDKGCTMDADHPEDFQKICNYLQV